MCYIQAREKVRHPSSATDLSLCTTLFLNLVYIFSAFCLHLKRCLLKGPIAQNMGVQLNPCSWATGTRIEMWWTIMTWVHSSKPKACTHLARTTLPQHVQLWVFLRASRILHKCGGATCVWPVIGNGFVGRRLILNDPGV